MDISTGGKNGLRDSRDNVFIEDWQAEIWYKEWLYGWSSPFSVFWNYTDEEVIEFVNYIISQWEKKQGRSNEQEAKDKKAD